jgi:hypothetical protein
MRLPIGLVIFVCCVGTIVGGSFGLLAGIVYGHWDSIGLNLLGMATGAGAGLLAGILWCRWFFRAFRPCRPARALGVGILAGVVMGCLATAILHTVLMVASRSVNPGLLLVALICALVSGALAGGFCGTVCSVMLKRGHTLHDEPV